MKKDNYIYILHIRDSINKIIEYTSGITFYKFERETIIQDALIRKFEIIGEASSKLSKDFIDKYDFVPWRKIIGM